MASDYYGQYMGTFRNLLTTTLEPLERVASMPSELHRWYIDGVTDIALLEKEVLQLSTENLMLKARLQRLDHLELELDRLQRLLGTTGRMNAQSLRIASVLHYSASPLSQYLTVNKGSFDGVETNQAVIDAYGVMGQITSLTPTSSRVLLITDPEHQLPVRIQRTGQRGILTGLGHDLVNLDFIPHTSSVREGDMLVTSGLGGVFPEGYPVAEVTEVISQTGLSYLSIKARPVADIHSSYEVLILSRSRSQNER